VRLLHVLVDGAPGLLRDVVRRVVATQPDMSLTPDRVVRVPPLTVAQRDDASVTVLILEQARDAEADAQLRVQFPPRPVVAVYAGGERVALYRYELSFTRRLPADSSAEKVLDAIRESAGAPATE
jgi:hypothetical protein